MSTVRVFYILFGIVAMSACSSGGKTNLDDAGGHDGGGNLSGDAPGLETKGGTRSDAGPGQIVTVADAGGDSRPAVFVPPIWGHSLGAANASPLAVTVAADGSIYISGTWKGTSNFGNGPLTSTGERDIFISKFDSSGMKQWVKTFGGPGDEFPNTIKADRDGTIVLSGSFKQSITFGSVQLISQGSADVFVLRFDSSSNVLGAFRIGSVNYDVLESLDLASDGTLLLCGFFDFKERIMKVDSVGTSQWEISYKSKSPLRDTAHAVFDKDGSVVIAGAFDESAQLGQTALTSWGMGTFVVKYRPDGTQAWIRSHGDNGVDYVALGVAVHDSGNVYVGLIFDGNAKFGVSTLHGEGLDDIALIKYSPAGELDWSAHIGGASSQWIDDVAVDGSENVLVTGSLDAELHLGETTLTEGTDLHDRIFVAKYNSGGNLLWATPLGQPDGGTSWRSSLVTLPGDDVVVTAEFKGQLDFGNGTVVNAAGDTDVFMARLPK